MDLSIIIPVWNEENKIQKDLTELDEYFKNTSQKVEVIITDDGSTDNTIQKVNDLKDKLALPVKLIALRHMGKGKAVREGMHRARGSIVMYMDSGGNVPLRYITKGTDLIVNGNDLVMASRNLKESIIIKPQIWYRRLLSIVFRTITRIILKTPKKVSDSQCGFKLFKADAAQKLFAHSKLNGFLFDLELILQAQKNNYQIAEFPIEWQNDRDSRFNILGSVKQIVRDLIYLKNL